MNTTDTPKRIHFVTLGCSKNEVDTETMLAGLPGHYTLTDDASDAEVIVVNTCAFLESAKEQSIDKIIEMAEMRDAGRMEKLVVTGCLAQRYPEELARELPEVDHFVGTNDLTKVTALLDDEAADASDLVRGEGEFGGDFGADWAVGVEPRVVDAP